MSEVPQNPPSLSAATVTYIRAHRVMAYVSLGLALLPVLLLFATWGLTYDKMYYTATYMPALVGVGVFIALVVWCVGVLCRKVWLDVLAAAWGTASALGVFIMLTASLSKLTYFFMAGAPYFVAALLVACIVLLWCGGLRLKRKAYRVGCIVFTIVVALVLVLGVFNLQPVYYNSGAVVFAVEDEYQICWSTSTTTTGYVEVAGNTYTDADAGSLHVSKIHKVSVPRTLLDAAGTYTVVSNGITLNRAYLTVRTGEIRRSYDFRTVDASDGLQIYNVSDNHLYTAGAIKAGSYWGDKLDILVANGDHLNDVSADWQITNLYRMLSAITGSARPVILSRGNHEAVGSNLQELPRYFASREGTFYYTVRFADTLFVVLDLANDMRDDKAVIAATADFNRYRAEELSWLEALKGSAILADPTIQHVVAVCHIAFPLNLERYAGDTSRQMLSCLEDMGVQIMLAGHSHKVVYFPAAVGENAAAFPVVLGSLRSDDYVDQEGLGGAHFTGTAVDITPSAIEVRFTNSRHQVRETYVLSGE